MLDREKLIETISDYAAEAADFKTLLQYYIDSQVEYMESLDDEELLDYAEIYLFGFDEQEWQIEDD